MLRGQLPLHVQLPKVAAAVVFVFINILGSAHGGKGGRILLWSERDEGLVTGHLGRLEKAVTSTADPQFPSVACTTPPPGQLLTELLVPALTSSDGGAAEC